MQIFKAMEKSEISMLIKHNNDLICVIRTLLRRKQRLRGDMLTLNVVVRTQMMPNGQIPKFGSCPGKHQKTPQTRFGRL